MSLTLKYNVELPAAGVSRKNEEILAIEEFLGSKMKNMCIEYADEKTAKNRARATRDAARKLGMADAFTCVRAGRCVYILRPAAEPGVQAGKKRSGGA